MSIISPICGTKGIGSTRKKELFKVFGSKPLRDGTRYFMDENQKVYILSKKGTLHVSDPTTKSGRSKALDKRKFKFV